LLCKTVTNLDLNSSVQLTLADSSRNLNLILNAQVRHIKKLSDAEYEIGLSFTINSSDEISQFFTLVDSRISSPVAPNTHPLTASANA